MKLVVDLFTHKRIYSFLSNRNTINHIQIMSSKNTNFSEGLSGFSLDPDFTDCSSRGQSGPTSLKELIENELAGVPLHVQKAALSHLLHLLDTKNASHHK